MKTVSAQEFAALFDDHTVVIDVREPAEYAQAHVPGAVLIPLAQLPARKGEVPDTGPVYVICASGNRSKVGASVLEASGIDAYSVEDGTAGWLNIGRPYVAGREPR